MKENFDEALAAVLVHEGGYVNHPRDPGGATNKGITHRTYAAWLHKHGKPTKDVRNITDAEVAAIYREQYWNVIHGDDLPHGVDYAVFDFAVNSGPARAAKFLQRIVGVAADGIIGLQTLRAVESTGNDREVIRALCRDRLAWLKKLRHWPTFGRGWERRVNEVLAKSLRLATTTRAIIEGREETVAAQGKADGPVTTRAALADMVRDPKALAGAAVAAVPGAARLAEGDGPVQWGIGAALVIGALAVAFLLWRNGREET